MNMNDNIEVFVPIGGYETLYEVSSFGRVRSLDKPQKNPYYYKCKSFCMHKGKILKLGLDRYGYLTINLKDYRKTPKQKTCTVHRLVAINFIPNPDNLPCVNHIDFNRQNNHINNLEWVTVKQNSSHTVSHGRQVKGEKVNTNKLTRGQVIDIIKLGNRFTQKELAKKYKVTQVNISEILLGHTWKDIPRVSPKVKNKYYNYGKKR